MTPSCPTPKKQRYRSEHAARLVIVELAMRQNRGGRPADERWPYRCPSGRHWHLTSHPQAQANGSVAL